jgi:hypothetical protein
MFSFLRQTFRQWARTGTRTGAQRSAVRRPQCEGLEDRVLLSLTGAQLFAASFAPGSHAAVASSADGSSVVAWDVEVGPNDRNVMAQRFDASGHKVGGEIAVATGPNNQYEPAVAIDARGDFVVAWTLDFSPTDKDIHAALFRANGTPVVSDIPVAASFHKEWQPSVGMDARGDFVVSYTYQFGPGDTDVKGAAFDAGGRLDRNFDVAVTTRVEANSRVNMTPGGNFSISYTADGQPLARTFSGAEFGFGGAESTGHSSRGTEHADGSGHHHRNWNGNGKGHGHHGNRHGHHHGQRHHHINGNKNGHHHGNGNGSRKGHGHHHHGNGHGHPPVPDRTALGSVLTVHYTVGPRQPDSGVRYHFKGAGVLAGLDRVEAVGFLQSTGFVRSGRATGLLDLKDEGGAVTLRLAGPRQGGFARLPGTFAYTVEGGTGAFHDLRGRGTVLVHLDAAHHALTLKVEPGGA